MADHPLPDDVAAEPGRFSRPEVERALRVIRAERDLFQALLWQVTRSTPRAATHPVTAR
ncbi:hypothetical protein [Cereibacter azotoformans]|uniref:Uncharacterized protein n=1 Tax=Cereibacter azotoformans TaxID=43057 RepID=A0A2T5JSH4_9RHOB|nr:hypothetical protein [Cereibacter azotoformans]MBO4168899.1 hypothetical protein [Cereibacter azotoformans]PTR11175.1 hypothetical protein C8J28_12836 [Cereibacter azotoformans]